MTHKSHYDPAKEKWREAWFQFIRKHKHNLKGKPKDWQVAFFPGEEALEVKVYDELRIPRENLLALEKDPQVYERLKKKKLGIRLTNDPIDAKDFFGQTNERFDIVNLDYEGFLDHSVVETLQLVSGRQILQERSLFALVIYGKRDSNDAKNVYYSALMGDEFANTIQNLIHGKSLTLDENSFQTSLDRFMAMPINEHRNKALTTVLINVFFKGSANLGINPIYARNPNSSELEKVIEIACILNGGIPKPDQAIMNFMHYMALITHIKKSGIASNDEEAILQARLALTYQNMRYFPKNIERFSYVSKNGAVMLSDFFHFDQHRAIIDRHGYIAQHAYVDLNMEGYWNSVFGGRPTSRSQVIRATDRLKKDLEFLFGDAAQNISDPPKTRISLGSSAGLPRLDGEEYYRQRFKDHSQGTSLPQTWNRLMHEFKVKRSQLPRFEAHYTMETHGPKAVSPDERLAAPAQKLEVIVAADKFELVPHQYWNRLPDPFKQRIRLFVEEDLRVAGLDTDQTKRLVGEVRASKWYKTLNGHQLSDLQFYAFFDDILLEMVNGNIPDRRKIAEIFVDVIAPNWQEKQISKVKLVLTLPEYERLSFYEKRSDEWILERYNTPKPNSVSAFKAWVTRKHGKQTEKDDLGVKVAKMIREGKQKPEIMSELSLEDYQYRGFLAAYKRGAYRKAFRVAESTKAPNIYVDSHGVVHVNPKNRAETEKGYK